MSLYIVTRKSDGIEVFRYDAPEPIDWPEFPMAEHNHELFLPAAPPPVPQGVRHVTKLAFRRRFTREEKAAIELAAVDDPSAPLPQRLAAAAVRADLADQSQAIYIDLKRPDTRAGVQALESVGLIAAGRAAQILDAEPTEIEVYRG